MPFRVLGSRPGWRCPASANTSFTCDIEDLGSASGTFVIETRRVRGDDSVVAARTIFSSSTLADFPQVGRLAGWWEVRLRCSTYGGGSFNLSVSR